MKETLRKIFLETLEDLRLDEVMHRSIRVDNDVLIAGDERIELAPFKKIIAVAIGKAADRMARELVRSMEPRQVTGVIVSSVPPSEPLPYFLRYQGGHPYPNAESFHAAAVVTKLVEDLHEQHLVLYLLSGGGSAICERPISPSISQDDCREFFRLLVTCGADIVQMNVLRKHLSAIKGGRLAATAYPARQLTLFVSDVPAGRDSSVASGPTMPDESTVDDCYRLAAELNLLERLPASIRRLFDERKLEETPKPGDPVFSTSSFVRLLENRDAVDAVQRRARSLGWRTAVDLSVDDQPVAQAAATLLERLAALHAEDPSRPAAVLTGGELSSPVVGDGRGGRSQAFVLECVGRIAGKKIAVISAGTDGIDGNSPAAGAVADGDSLARACETGLDPAEFAERVRLLRLLRQVGRCARHRTDRKQRARHSAIGGLVVYETLEDLLARRPLGRVLRTRRRHAARGHPGGRRSGVRRVRRERACAPQPGPLSLRHRAAQRLHHGAVGR